MSERICKCGHDWEEHAKHPEGCKSACVHQLPNENGLVAFCECDHFEPALPVPPKAAAQENSIPYAKLTKSGQHRPIPQNDAGSMASPKATVLPELDVALVANRWLEDHLRSTLTELYGVKKELADTEKAVLAWRGCCHKAESELAAVREELIEDRKVNDETESILKLDLAAAESENIELREAVKACAKAMKDSTECITHEECFGILNAALSLPCVVKVMGE